MPTHVIKSRVGKLKTRVGKLKKNFRRFAPNFLSKNVCPPWPETVPAPLIGRLTSDLEVRFERAASKSPVQSMAVHAATAGKLFAPL